MAMDGVAMVTVMQSRVTVRLGIDTLIATILVNDHVGGIGSVEERRSLAGGLSLSCARPAADG